jgi:thioredoxin:protein disulfide reductase
MIKRLLRYWIIGLSLILLPFYALAQAPLSVQNAFKIFASIEPDKVVKIRFEIAPYHYLYQDKFSFHLKLPKKAKLGRIIKPQGAYMPLPFLKGQRMYTERVEIFVPILNLGKDQQSTLTITYQGCSEEGYCYPPVERFIHLNFKNETAKISLAPNLEQSINDSSQAVAWLEKQPLWLIPLGFIGFGLLLSLTPCVFPMIPILSSIILGYRNQLTMWKAFLLSLTYVVSMASMYAVIGAVAASIGHNFQIWFQKPIVIIVFSLLIIVLALCSFTGFYRLKLPLFLKNVCSK